MSQYRVLCLLAAVTVGLASCSSSIDHTQAERTAETSNPKPSTSEPTSIPPSTSASQSSNPAPASTTTTNSGPAAAALKAYLAYVAVIDSAERSPGSNARQAKLAAVTVDPQQERDGAMLLQYSLNHLVWRGTPPAARATVSQTRLDARPYPTVIVRDCPTLSTTWKPYDTSHHTVVPVQYPKGSAKPPFGITASVVKYQSRWRVEKVTTSMRTTCVPA